MSKLDRLYEILNDTCVQLRKGERIQRRIIRAQSAAGSVDVIEVFAMPHECEADDNLTKVDMCLLTIGVDVLKAEAYREDIVSFLENDYPERDRLREGPSYIEVGAAIGDQGAALMLFALGEALGLWEVITPAKLGVPAERAREVAGMGYVMTTGY